MLALSVDMLPYLYELSSMWHEGWMAWCLEMQHQITAILMYTEDDYLSPSYYVSYYEY